MRKKYIDELCRIYGKRDIKQLAYLAYVYHFSELCNMNIDERWLLYEIGRNLKDDDLKYVLSFLESNDKEKIAFSANLLNNIFELNADNKAFIKNCVLNAEKLNISSRFITKLLKSVNEQSFYEECIKKSNEIGLESYDLYEIIKNVNDTDFLKYCVDNSNRIGLHPNEVINVINDIGQKTGDYDYTFTSIENWKSLNLNSAHITNLLLNIKNASKIIPYIENWRNYGLTPNNVSFIIKTSMGKKYAQSAIERAEEFEFDIDDIFDIVNSIDDKKYVMDAIRNGFLNGLDSYSLGMLIYRTNDRKFIKECLKNKKKLNLEDSEIDILISAYKQLEFLKLNKSQIRKKVQTYKENYQRKIELPPYMTFGIEIECVGQLEKDNMKKILKKLGNWCCEDDKSVSGDEQFEEGIEVISPVLLVNGKNPTDEIKEICAILNYFGQYPNKTCGGHIHIGGNYLKSVDAYKNLLELWSNTEQILYIISNEEGTIPRNGVDPYAFPISKDLINTLKTGTVNLSTEEDLATFKTNLRIFENSRFKGINLTNMDPQVIRISKLPTIEFRIPNGTVDADVWIDNINLFGGLIKASEKLAKIKNTNRKITPKEQLMIEQFEMLKSGNLSEEQKLDILLNLTVSEKSKKIYISRYKKNSKLLNEDPELIRCFNENISKEPINMPRSKKSSTDTPKVEDRASKPNEKEEDEYAR